MITKENILERFLFCATEHGIALWQSDHKKANKIHKELQELYNKAKEENVPHIFSELLHEEDAHVRVWAAAFTLKVYPEIAEKVLLEVGDLKGFAALNAITILKLWKQGMLNLL